MKKKLKQKTAKKKVSKKRTMKARVKIIRASTTAKAPTVIRSVNPYTEEVMNEFMTMSPAEVRAIIARSREAFASWRDQPVAERLSRVKRLGEVLRTEKRNYAQLITREMGKPIKDAIADASGRFRAIISSLSTASGELESTARAR